MSPKGNVISKAPAVHECPFFPGDGATREQCTSQSQIIPKNEQACILTRCRSLWRFCLSCLKQGYKDPVEARVSNYATGLCEFHQEHGKKQQRQRERTASRNPHPIYLAPSKTVRGVEKPLPQQRHLPSKHMTEVSRAPRIQEVVEDEEAELTFEERLSSQPIRGLLALGEEHPEVGLMVPTGRIRPMKGQPREEFDEAGIVELAGSLNVLGQAVPAQVYALTDDSEHDYEIVDGERRWRACQLIKKDLWVILVRKTSREGQFVRSAVANFGRKGHTPIEFAHTINTVIREQGWSLKQTALVFSVSVQTVVNHKRLLKLAPGVLALMKTNPDPEAPPPLGMTSALSLVAYPPQFQITLARDIFNRGLNLHEARRHIQQESHKHGIKPKIGKRDRRPSDDFQVTLSKLQGVNRRLSDVLGVDEKFLDSVFKSCGPANRISIRDLLKEIKTKAEKIHTFCND